MRHYRGIGAIHSSSASEEKKIRYCPRCEELFQIQARLGPRIMPLDETTGKPRPKPSDYEHWLECRNCGSVYAKEQTKVEPTIEPIVTSKTLGKGKAKGIGQKRKGRGNNPRIKTRDEIKDKDLLMQLRSGAQLISYSSTDPL